MGQPRPLFRLFLVFQSKPFLQQINVKNIRPVYVTGIRTHNLSNMSRHPYPPFEWGNQMGPGIYAFQIFVITTSIDFNFFEKLPLQVKQLSLHFGQFLGKIWPLNSNIWSLWSWISLWKSSISSSTFLLHYTYLELQNIKINFFRSSTWGSRNNVLSSTFLIQFSRLIS